MNNNKVRLLFLCTALLSTFLGLRFFQDDPDVILLPNIDLNAVFKNDKQATLAVKKTNPKPIVGNGATQSGATLTQEKLEKIAEKIRHSRQAKVLPSVLPFDKQQELELFKQRFNSSGDSELRFDTLGRVRAIYDEISL